MRLRGTPARLEELVRGRPHEALIRRREQEWSIQENAGHLLDLEPLWNARVDDYLSGSGQLTPADLNNRKTNEANHNARELSEVLSQFRGERRQLVERVEQLEAELFSRSMIHPRLQQPMRLVDHLFFIAEHDDHHLARIWELLRTAPVSLSH